MLLDIDKIRDDMLARVDEAKKLAAMSTDEIARGIDAACHDLILRATIDARRDASAVQYVRRRTPLTPKQKAVRLHAQLSRR